MTNLIGRNVKIIEINNHQVLAMDMDTFEIVVFKSHVTLDLINWVPTITKSLNVWVRPGYPNEVKRAEEIDREDGYNDFI